MKSTTNVFSGGLVTDLHPITVQKNQLTDALNATFITHNGNELILQNDMGNTRIQDRVTGSIMGLKEGFIPLAMKEHGGILYIASYNPKTYTSELGSIPSPLFEYTYIDDNVLTQYNSTLFDVSTFEVTENPIILENHNRLFYSGDSITCGLEIENYNQTLIRKSNNIEYKYPIISTREKTGAVTLQVLSIPGDSHTIINLNQHLPSQQNDAKQWFYNMSSEDNIGANTIIYPNFKSGVLAIKPTLQKISNIQVLQNDTTQRLEPYYVRYNALCISISYIGYTQKWVMKGSSAVGAPDYKYYYGDVLIDSDSVIDITYKDNQSDSQTVNIKSNTLKQIITGGNFIEIDIPKAPSGIYQDIYVNGIFRQNRQFKLTQSTEILIKRRLN